MPRLAIPGILAFASAAILLLVSAVSPAWATLPEYLPTTETKLTGVSGATEFRTGATENIKCPEDVVTGVASGGTVTWNYEYKLCKFLGFQINSLGDGPGIILMRLNTTLLCYISKAENRAGVDLATTGVEMEVPAIKSTLLLSGGAVAELKPVNKKESTGEQLLTQKEGKQSLLTCEGGKETHFSISVNGGAAKAAGVESTESLKFASALELMA